MRKPLTQIPLDFGGNHEASSPNADGNPSPHDGQYLASAGVGVRVKAFKKPGQSSNSDLFDASAPAPEYAAPSSEYPAPGSATAAQVQPEPVSELQPTPVPEFQPNPVHESQPDQVSEFQPVLVPETQLAAAATRPLRDARPTKSAVKAGPSKRGRKSLKQVAAEADLIEIPADEVLFGKQYYTMGEVSEMFKVNQSLLRYWETEFDILQPRKNKKGDRYFRPVDIKNLHLIYHLLRQKKYTIEGAKEFLRNNKKAKERFEVIERLQQIRNFLLEWKAQL